MAELDLSYTPPLGSPWDAIQMATQAWEKEHQLDAARATTAQVRADVAGTQESSV